jgi:zinc metalloprotease ZmpB
MMNLKQQTSILATAVIMMTCVARESAPAQHASRVQYAGSLKIDEQGTPRAMFGLSATTNQKTPELAARAFLAAHKRTMRLDNSASEFVTDDVVSVPGGSHVRLSQNFNGVPVYGADVVVSLNNRNEITMVVNNACADIDVPTAPSITSAEAIALAREVLRTSAETIGQDDAATLTIFADTLNAYHLVYRVTMTREHPAGDWEVLIDAVSGATRKVQNLFVNYIENGRVDGRGFAYLTDPLSAAQQTYGAPGFTDNNDQDSDSLSANRALVTLDSITYLNGVFQLRGPFCTITDIETPIDSAITSPTPDGFLFNRSQQGFEAVNAYYHVSQAYKRLRDLGFNSAKLQKIRIDPHGFQGQDNSHYSPTGNWISFGTGGVDDAEDADVIWHEYCHAIQYCFSPTWGGGETAALGEGYSDYWAASYSRSLNQWSTTDDQYAWVYNWDGHNSCWAGRRVDDSREYPFTNLSAHVAGQIWASTLIGIADDLGRDVTDRLVLKSILYLGYGATAVDAARALIQADNDLYEGAHLSTLISWLGTTKKFLDEETVKAFTTGVDVAEGALPASFNLAQNYPNPFNPSTTIPFVLSKPATIRMSVYTMLGQEVRMLVSGSFAAGSHSVIWDGTSSTGQRLASGAYLCRLQVEPADGSTPLSFTHKMAMVR